MIRWLSAAAIVGLCACAELQDVPANPALANVQILYLEMSPEKIAKAGKSIDAPAMCSAPGAHCTVLAYSIPMGPNCLVVLPPKSDPNWARLKIHEDRHCHGELHPGRARFRDEYPI